MERSSNRQKHELEEYAIYYKLLTLLTGISLRSRSRSVLMAQCIHFCLHDLPTIYALTIYWLMVIISEFYLLN